MMIYRVKQLPPPYPPETLGGYGSGVAYIRKDLPIPIQIVVLLHEVGHHLFDKVTSFFFKTELPFKIISCLIKLWILFMERKDELICRKWMVKT